MRVRPGGQRPQHQRPVRNRLVARHPDACRKAARTAGGQGFGGGMACFKGLSSVKKGVRDAARHRAAGALPPVNARGATDPTVAAECPRYTAIGFDTRRSVWQSQRQSAISRAYDVQQAGARHEAHMPDPMNAAPGSTTSTASPIDCPICGSIYVIASSPGDRRCGRGKGAARKPKKPEYVAEKVGAEDVPAEGEEALADIEAGDDEIAPEAATRPSSRKRRKRAATSTPSSARSRGRGRGLISSRRCAFSRRAGVRHLRFRGVGPNETAFLRRPDSRSIARNSHG